VRLPSHPIIDAHAHLGDWFRSYANAGWADGLVRTMDRLNIRHTALTAFDAIGPDMRGGNDQVAAAMRAHPGRFLGYATVDPNEPKAMAAELERCFEQLGFHAIKFHCGTHGYPAESERYRPALEYAEARGLCVLIHGSITERLLETYPRALFLSAHVGGWDGRAPNAAVELSKRHANLFLDLTSSAAWNGAIEALVQEAGAERIVFGSDVPLMDPGYQLGRVLGSLLSADEKRRILYENAARLFRIS
jgi:predicted TIM-barrel fold metal-dependent hydrolase